MASHKVQTVDLSAFTTSNSDVSTLDRERVHAAKDLVEACRTQGFVKIRGHGLTQAEVDDAFTWVKRLFDLPEEEKLRAPHPPGNMPHRGYSGIGLEKVYSIKDLPEYGSDKTPRHRSKVSQELRKSSDFKESYEVGSEQDDQQTNIWLPDDVLAGFRTYMTSLYERLAGVTETILEAIGVGLGLNEQEHAALMQLHSARHSQLRLIHYPRLDKEALGTKFLARLPAHTDWGTMTILFQDRNGGLELRDPHTRQYLKAEPEEGTLVLNIGDMLQRFTNDYFISATHKVSVPDSNDVPVTGLPARYSIPFFVGPMPSHTVATLSRFITPDSSPAKYEPVKFGEYGSIVSQYQYEGEE
ncbi:Clavaminate synthase-like protein [Rhypophila decipiens]|uniref:Clavaminate synthase-like protein n=1 Tax=Rhypophila decipiens TaxID=261697 RepID=A0AAN6Y099_9PEZI|nr:Clavaminate synthase-like protein [Rhypophila decipiens]